MTAQEFINLFAQYASLIKWRFLTSISNRKMIVSEEGECPICFVDRLHNPDNEHHKYLPSCTKLGKEMLESDKTLVIVAADDRASHTAFSANLRKQLLELTGLV